MKILYMGNIDGWKGDGDGDNGQGHSTLNTELHGVQH